MRSTSAKKLIVPRCPHRTLNEFISKTLIFLHGVARGLRFGCHWSAMIGRSSGYGRVAVNTSEITVFIGYALHGGFIHTTNTTTSNYILDKADVSWRESAYI